MIPQEPRVKQKVRSLKNPRLRKVRYELRTLLFLLFEENKRKINLRMGEVRRDDSFSFDGRGEKLKELLKERESLFLSFCRSPINCSLCGNREEDLIEYDLLWFCYNQEDCRQRRIKLTQSALENVQRRIREISKENK